MGGVIALLRAVRGLGIHPTLGLSTELGSPPDHLASLGPTHQGFTVSHTTDKDEGPSRPDIMLTSPAASGQPQGLQSTVNLEVVFPLNSGFPRKFTEPLLRICNKFLVGTFFPDTQYQTHSQAQPFLVRRKEARLWETFWQRRRLALDCGGVKPHRRTKRRKIMHI